MRAAPRGGLIHARGIGGIAHARMLMRARAAGQVVSTRRVAPTRQHTATFVDLQPDTPYLVSVTAHSLLVQDGAADGGVQPVNVTATTLTLAAAPTALKSLNTGADYVALAWSHTPSPGVSGGVHFRLRFNATGRGHGSMLASQQRSKSFVSTSLPPLGGLVCAGLMPSTEYHVSLVACGPGGCSTEHSILVWTAPYAPLDFKVSTISSSPTAGISISFTWKPPCAVSIDATDAYPSGDGNPVPSCTAGVQSPLSLRYYLSYRILVTEREFGPWSTETASDGSGAMGAITVSGLTLGADYQARLVGVFQGLRSEPIYVTAKVTSLPSTVEDFAVAPDSRLGILEQSLTLRWRPPGASAVSHYKLSWAKVVASVVESYAADGGGLGAKQSGVVEFDMRLYNEFTNGSGYNYYRLSGLETHALYSFKIQARNFNGLGYEAGLGCAAGASVLSTPSCITASPVQQPAAVQQLSVTAAVEGSSESFVEFEWMPPPGSETEFLNSLVYRVSRAIVSGALVGTEEELAAGLPRPNGAAGSLKSSYRDTTVVPDVTYRYRVQARNRNSLGWDAGSTVLGTSLSATCTSADADCAVSNVRAVAFVGRELPDTSGIGVVVEWDTPPGLFAGQPEYFYYAVKATTDPQMGWGDANWQVWIGAGGGSALPIRTDLYRQHCTILYQHAPTRTTATTCCRSTARQSRDATTMPQQEFPLSLPLTSDCKPLCISPVCHSRC